MHGFVTGPVHVQESGAPTRTKVTISAIQIYKEKVHDLLAAGSPECEVLKHKDRVLIRQASKQPLAEFEAASVAEAMFHVNGALQSRTTRGTACAPLPSTCCCSDDL